jgi:3-hydroxybutyryl-CoA dehydrogenase
MNKQSFIVGVCGAGAMGAGIAQVAAQAGHPVFVFDPSNHALKAGKERLAIGVKHQVDRGNLSAGEGQAFCKRLTWTSDLSALADVDLVIEAIIEDAAVKTALFEQLEAIVRPDAIIASNTSSLPISRLARHLKHPERFVGMHFFNPAPVMKLVEIIAGAATSADVALRVQTIASAWGKISVPVADVAGFIVNRVARPFYSEAFTALNEGVDPATIDALFRSAGFRMGPLELTDLIGQDINFAVARSVYESYFGRTRFVPQVRQAALVDAGWLGRKTGRGVYDYGNERPSPGTGAIGVASGAQIAAGTQVLKEFSGVLIDCDGISIGRTGGCTARFEAGRHNRPVALLDWFENGSGVIGFAASDDAAAMVAAGVIASWDR